MPQVLPNSRIHANAFARATIFDAPAALRYWHLASLDAPTVALVWAVAFAWTVHVRLPLWVPVLLPLAVWAVYVSDRLLDARRALRSHTLDRLRDRHLYHWRHRRILLPLAAAAAISSACIVFTLMPAVAQERNSILAAASLAYFTRVHTGHDVSPRLSNFLSKEFLVGVLFTVGCVIPAWSRISASTHETVGTLLTTTIFFVLLAWLNCRAIDRWEAGPAEEATVKRASKGAGLIKTSSRMKGTGLRRYIDPSNRTRALAPKGHLSNPRKRDDVYSPAILLALAGLLLAALFLTKQPRSAALLIAGSASALLFALLDKRRARIAPVALRATADLVLLTPVLLIPFTKFFQ